METTKFEIESTKSRIDWIGRKVTGAHNGTIEVKEGELLFSDGKLTGGTIAIDTTTIKILDIADAATNAQFAGHLASDDFFAIEKFPTATFEILSVRPLSGNQFHLEGSLTIKGITHAAGLDATIENHQDNVTLAGKLIVDRTRYGIKFRSGNFFKDLGDTLIYNDFELDTVISATSKN